MKHRVWLVAGSLLSLGAALFWQQWGADPAVPTLMPPVVSSGVDLPPITNPFGAAAALPKELPSETFTEMIAEFSEPGGSFMYENFLSNERSYQDPIPSLVDITKPGGVYLGVG